MKTGRRAVLAGTLGAAVAGVAHPWPAHGEAGGPLRLDFGDTTPAPAPGYVRVGTETYDEALGFGWVSAAGLAVRDRGGEAPGRDFVFGTAASVFRIGSLAPGRYRLSFLSGDLNFGDHFTRLQVPGVDGGEPLPVLNPGVAQYAELTATFVVADGATSIDITIDAPESNWVVNALIVEPTTDPEPVRVVISDAPIVSTWGPILTSPDPTAPLLQGHRRRAAHRRVRPTGLRRADYLRLITSEVDFWKAKQDADGAIIDPYRKPRVPVQHPGLRPRRRDPGRVRRTGRPAGSSGAGAGLVGLDARRTQGRGRPRGLLRADDRARDPAPRAARPRRALRRLEARHRALRAVRRLPAGPRGEQLERRRRERRGAVPEDGSARAVPPLRRGELRRPGRALRHLLRAVPRRPDALRPLPPPLGRRPHRPGLLRAVPGRAERGPASRGDHQSLHAVADRRAARRWSLGAPPVERGGAVRDLRDLRGPRVG